VPLGRRSVQVPSLLMEQSIPAIVNVADAAVASDGRAAVCVPAEALAAVDVVDWSPLQPETVDTVVGRYGFANASSAWANYVGMQHGRPWAHDVDEAFKSYLRKLRFDTAPVSTTSAPHSVSRLKAATLAAARARAPDWDVVDLERRFFDWNAGLGTVLKQPDAAFIAWVKTFTKSGRPN
jgi:hypothetical protein